MAVTAYAIDYDAQGKTRVFTARCWLRFVSKAIAEMYLAARASRYPNGRVVKLEQPTYYDGTIHIRRRDVAEKWLRTVK